MKTQNYSQGDINEQQFKQPTPLLTTSKRRDITHRNIMDKFFKQYLNPQTIILHPPYPYQAPTNRLEFIIQNALNNRATANPNFQPPHNEGITIRNIVEKAMNIHKVNTYQGTTFQCILLIKQENILDIHQLCLACPCYFITPKMITNYTTKQLLHYAYIISINPNAISRLCNTTTVDLNHDYYKDLFKLQ